jgi:hypothetical protein
MSLFDVGTIKENVSRQIHERIKHIPKFHILQNIAFSDSLQLSMIFDNDKRMLWNLPNLMGL